MGNSSIFNFTGVRTHQRVGISKGEEERKEGYKDASILRWVGRSEQII